MADTFLLTEGGDFLLTESGDFLLYSEGEPVFYPQGDLFEMVEIDLPLCANVYGTAPCAAVLGTTGVRKCYNLRATCQSTANYTTSGVLTLRFVKAGPIPTGVLAFPTLQKVSQNSATVNIAGSDNRYSQLGKRATLSFTLGDFTYHERGIDPYVAQRISGTAQTDEGGYDPASRGTFLAKLKARWPNYQDAKVRLIRGYLVNGVVTDQTTYNYLMSEMAGPSNGELSCKAQGVLNLADAKKALCPKPSQGALTADLTAVATSLTVTPTGIGSTYSASGKLCIDSEIMNYTRAGDVFTLTRGVRGTTAATHTAGASVQETFSVTLVRIDEVARRLVQDYTDTPASYVTFADWQAEALTWAPSLVLQSDVVTPTPVATLLSELADLGAQVFEDERNAKLRFRMNRPARADTIRDITDQTAKSIEQEDRDDDRITQVLFRTKRSDPTKTITDKANYQRNLLTVDTEALALYGATKTRELFTRWLDQGDDATAQIVSVRLLNRFKKAPKRVKVVLDARDKSASLMDVLRITSTDLPNETGAATAGQWQVIGRSEPRPYHEVELEAQAYDFTGKYSFIMQNTANVYGSATDTEKSTGGYIVGATLKFPDGAEAYRII